MALKNVVTQAKEKLEGMAGVQQAENSKSLGAYKEQIQALESKIQEIQTQGTDPQTKADLDQAIQDLENAQKDLEKARADLDRSNVLEDRNPGKIPLLDRFKALWTMKPEDLENITQSMKANGYDRTNPVIIGRWGNVEALLDGHTRREASILADLPLIPCLVKEFPGEQEAFEYASNLQLARRNLTEWDRLNHLMSQKQFFSTGENNSEGERKAGRPREEFGVEWIKKTLKVSTGTASKYLKVMTAPKSFLDSIKAGNLSINQAYNELTAPEKTPKKEGKVVSPNVGRNPPNPQENPQKEPQDTPRDRLQSAYEEAFKTWRDNGKKDYDAGMADGLKRALLMVEGKE